MSRRSPQFDISGVIWEWQHRQGDNKYRQNLMTATREGAANSVSAKLLLTELGRDAIAQSLNPVSTFALVLNFGVAIGTLAEQAKVSAQSDELLVDEAIQCWVHRLGITDIQRGSLLQEIRHDITHSMNAERWIKEIVDAALTTGMTPVGVMCLALNYGLSLGVLIEQERFERHLRKVV